MAAISITKAILANRVIWSCMLVILAGVVSSPARADLVVNGGFETGNFDGWTIGNSNSYFGVTTGDPHSGTYCAFFGGAVGDYGVIYQDLPTIPGDSYELSFWLTAYTYTAVGDLSDFQAYCGGILVQDFLNSGPYDYAEYTYVFTATTSSTELLFQGYHYPSFTRLDDVSVDLISASVPEPSSIILAGLGVSVSIFQVGWRRRRRSEQVADSVS